MQIEMCGCVCGCYMNMCRCLYIMTIIVHMLTCLRQCVSDHDCIDRQTVTGVDSKGKFQILDQRRVGNRLVRERDGERRDRGWQ